KGYFLYYNGHTINGMSGVQFPPVMNKNDIANLAILSRNLIVHANFIGYRSDDVIKPMKPEQMGELIGTEKRQTYRFLKKMIDNGLMAKVTFETAGRKDTHYLINPLYFMNGRNLNDMLYWAFQKQLDCHIPEWSKK